MWYLILLVALSDLVRGTDTLFLFKYGLSFKAGLRHLSWNKSGGSATHSSSPVAFNYVSCAPTPLPRMVGPSA
jgi:hypothetical protein